MNFLYKIFVKNHKNIKDSKVKQRYGLLASIIGIILNLILFSTKIVVSFISGSISIISDAFNNLSDASSSVITLIGFKMSSKPADKKHPFGHQRIEYICAFIVSIIILYIGIEVGVSSFEKILNPTEFEFNYIILLVLLLTVFIKLWMGVFYNKTSKKINSLSLKAAAKDAINDVVATSIIIIGLLISKYTYLNIDGYLGLLVCIYIIIGGFGLIKETIDKLIGGTPDFELIKKIKDIISKEVKILDIHDVLYHYYGGGKVYVSLHAEVDSSMSLVEAHDIIDGLERIIKKECGVEIVVHIDPVHLNDKVQSEIYKKIKPIIKGIDKVLSFHELKIKTKNGKTIVCFDLQVPFEFELSNEELYSLINKKLREIDEKYRASITFDKV